MLLLLSMQLQWLYFCRLVNLFAVGEAHAFGLRSLDQPLETLESRVTKGNTVPYFFSQSGFPLNRAF